MSLRPESRARSQANLLDDDFKIAAFLAISRDSTHNSGLDQNQSFPVSKTRLYNFCASTNKISNNGTISVSALPSPVAGPCIFFNFFSGIGAGHMLGKFEGK